MVLLEICVDSVESAKNAVYAGADRIELCTSLSEGGLTPSVGLFQAVKKITQNTKTKVFVMIRIRGGNFHYSEDEISAMTEDVKYFRSQNADGIVFGALTNDLKVDNDACLKILESWDKTKPATFHRAIDESKVSDLRENIQKIVNLGFSRLLTSGLEPTAEAGLENIKKIMEYAREMIVMPGSGLNKDNVEVIVNSTGCKEVHGSARTSFDVSTRLSVGGERFYVCDRRKVEEILEILNKK